MGQLPSLTGVLDAVARAPVLSAVAPLGVNDMSEALIELNCNGATFDLRNGGLLSDPLLSHNPALKAREEHSRNEIPTETLTIVPSGHIKSAQSSIPIVKAWWLTAAQLAAELENCAGVIWGPSAERFLVSDFVEQSDRWNNKGIFPPSGLVQCIDDLDDGLRTDGLSFFTKQELRIEPELVDDRDFAARLGRRLAQTLIHRETLIAAEEFIGPDGRKLKLVPSKNGKFVRVWRG